MIKDSKLRVWRHLGCIFNLILALGFDLLFSFSLCSGSTPNLSLLSPSRSFCLSINRYSFNKFSVSFPGSSRFIVWRARGNSLWLVEADLAGALPDSALQLVLPSAVRSAPGSVSLVESPDGLAVCVVCEAEDALVAHRYVLVQQGPQTLACTFFFSFSSPKPLSFCLLFLHFSFLFTCACACFCSGFGRGWFVGGVGDRVR